MDALPLIISDTRGGFSKIKRSQLAAGRSQLRPDSSSASNGTRAAFLLRADESPWGPADVRIKRTPAEDGGQVTADQNHRTVTENVIL